ncbi:MAG: type II 3-dehydroquinate dehydratase [Proteobacteria bacterium]|nr:type II 3-dehydroquinate dehydratase [Pseudomonadota bacterium]
MKILVLNGPNLNLLGRREPELYGRMTLEQIEASLAELGQGLGIETEFFQSNIEGELVDAIQRADREGSGVIINAGAYTHTSVALRDAAAGVAVPVVEVHLTNPQAREPFRQVSLLAGVAAGSISGFGPESYTLALLWFHRRGAS